MVARQLAISALGSAVRFETWLVTENVSAVGAQI
jgi:hypothetical protein